MTKNTENINVFFDGMSERFKKAVPNIIAETAAEYYRESFQRQSWNGAPWEPLSQPYGSNKKRGKGRILTASTNLANSIRPSLVSAPRVTISAGNAKVPYAQIHNEGGTITGVQYVRPHKRKNAFGKGKIANIKGHNRNASTRMPQRQFMGINKELKEQILTRLKTAFKS